MNSTALPNSTGPDDVLAACVNERLVLAYERIAHTDEQLARLTERLTNMEQGAARRPAAISHRGQSSGRPVLRGVVGLLTVACIAGAAFIAQSSYGAAARPVIARWVEPYIGSLWPALAKPEFSVAQATSGVRLAAAEGAFAPAALAAGSGAQDGVVASSELARLQQTMARDLATMQQGIEQLRAGQERIASDNAKAAEQVRMSQEQVTRLVAKISEQDQRARAPQVRPAADPARKPAQASQVRLPPLQLQPGSR
jgi:hypothetical protein